MGNPGITRDQWVEAEDALRDTGGNFNRAARSLDMDRMTFTNRVRSGRRRHNDGRPLYNVGRGSFEGDAQDGYLIKGRSTYYGADGEVRGEWVKTTADMERQKEIVKEAFSEMAKKLPRLPAKPKNRKDYTDNLLSVIPWGDPHFGLYTWAEETGDDFDTDIARRDLCAAVDYLVAQSPATKRCVIASLGDMFHIDNLSNTTPQSGHPLDPDTRLRRVARLGMAATRQCIDSALDRHETVEFVPVVGNHDPVMSMMLGVGLANIYENEPRVVIHDGATLRHYVRHGKVLLGFVHGDKTKDRDLPGIMATERAQEWGETRHRYWHRGHHHHAELQEFNGCLVEQHRTLAAGDAYAVGHGWLSGRDMKQIIYHADYGEVARSTCSVDMLRAA